jgi:rhodanese-related sulfurtransferase
MTNDIGVDTLRQWLDEHRQVAVIDVRTSDDRSQWWIPGSTHVDAYDALRKGEPGPLATLAMPAGRPVVTVCGAGQVSRTAAHILSARGFDAHSLLGGMKAWSVAWNVADVPLPDDHSRVVQVRRTGKGCLSYVIGSRGEAAVIDASLPSSVYLDLARGRGWRIRYVLDTHIHADHLSRGRHLAADAGARTPARQLFRSLSWLRSRRPSVLVLPGHTSTPIPFDGQPVASSIHDVNGWLSTWLPSEEAFLDRVLSRLPPTPRNFTQIVELNEQGEFPSDDPADLEAGANRCAVA